MVKKATQRAVHVEDEAPALNKARPGQNDKIRHPFDAEAEESRFDPSEDFRGAVDAFADPVRPRTDHEALLAKAFRLAAEMVMDGLSDITMALTQKHAREAASEVLLSAVRVRKGMERVRGLNETFHAHRNKSAKLVQVHADYARHGTLEGLPGSNASIADLESDHIAAHRGKLIDSQVGGFHRLMNGLNGAIDSIAEAIGELRRVVDARNTARIGNMEDAQQALMDAVLIASKALDFHCAGGIKHVTVVQARVSNDNKVAEENGNPPTSALPTKPVGRVIPPDDSEARKPIVRVAKPRRLKGSTAL